MADNKFTISVHSSGYYQVSIPNFHGGDVVPFEQYEALRSAADALLTVSEEAAARYHWSAHTGAPASPSFDNCTSVSCVKAHKALNEMRRVAGKSDSVNKKE